MVAADRAAGVDARAFLHAAAGEVHGAPARAGAAARFALRVLAAAREAAAHAAELHQEHLYTLVYISRTWRNRR